MSAIKKSHSIDTTANVEPHALRNTGKPRTTASRASPKSSDHLNLAMLCAMSRKTLSAQQRSLLIQLLVQSFADFEHYVPVEATRILVAAELPPVLERVTERIQASRQTWFAWTDNRRTWFLVAEMATGRDQTNHAAALRILFYDEDGECVATGTWAFHVDGQWTLLSL